MIFLRDYHLNKSVGAGQAKRSLAFVPARSICTASPAGDHIGRPYRSVSRSSVGAARVAARQSCFEIVRRGGPCARPSEVFRIIRRGGPSQAQLGFCGRPSVLQPLIFRHLFAGAFFVLNCQPNRKALWESL